MSSLYPFPSHAVTLDASFVIGLCAKEPDKYPQAQMVLQQRVVTGCTLHAPNLLVMEATYVLCGKLQSGNLALTEHTAALSNLHSLLAIINFPVGGDVTLISRAEHFRGGYGCSRSADSFYIALADHLALSGPSELLTFDIGQKNQATAVAPSVTTTLLTL